MKVIPVIDILNGVAVHAVRGKRSEYRPIQSILAESAEPDEVAKAFKEAGFSELYIADLDAIIDCRTDFKVLKKISETIGVKLMVDAGVTSVERAQKLLESGVAKIVVGTETLQNKNFVKDAIAKFGGDRVIVSLDLKDGKVLVKDNFEGCTEALCLFKEFKAMGVREFIVLDLTRVGSGEGVDIDFFRKVKAEVDVDVYVGGGVRNLQDLAELRAARISGVLVATALHTGKISVFDLKAEGFL